MAIRTKFGWVLAAIAGVAVAVVLLVLIVFNTGIAAKFLRGEIIRQASRYGADVEIGTLSTHLVPLGVEFGDVTAGSASSPQEPVLRAKRIVIGLRFLPLLHGKLQLSRLVLDEPVAHLR